MLIRIVRMTFDPEKIEAFLANFQENKAQIRGFAGCQYLALLRDKDQDNVFMTYSHWDSEQSLENYRKSDFFAQVWGFTKALFADKPVAYSTGCVDELP